MLKGYNLVNIADMLTELGEKQTKAILSEFSCPMNGDVEDFIRNKAIEFSKQGLAKTQLVLTSLHGKNVVAAYYSLSNKFIMLKRDVISKTLQKRIVKFGQYIEETQRYVISAPLIAQLSKNFTNRYNELISGDELLKIACDAVAKIQYEIGGKIVYLECEDCDKLKDFYSRNGFICFGSRKLDGDETGIKSERLAQLLKYLG